MRLEPGYVDGAPVVHLTHTTLLTEALCGGAVLDCAGEPDLAVMCDECDRIGRGAGADRSEWLHRSHILTLVQQAPSTALEHRAA
jgi:hypothetical protein